MFSQYDFVFIRINIRIFKRKDKNLLFSQYDFAFSAL